MRSNGWLVALLVAVIIIGVAVGVAFLFKWEVGFSIAFTITMSVIAFVIVAFINRNGGNEGTRGAAVFFIGSALIALAFSAGQQSDFAPSEHNYPSVCVMPYDIMGKVAYTEEGLMACRGQDFIDALDDFDFQVAGRNYRSVIEGALKDDLEEIYRAQEEGDKDLTPFSRFLEEWGKFQTVRVNEAKDRLVVPVGRQDKITNVSFVGIAAIFFLYSLMGLVKVKFLGGAKAFLGGLIFLAVFVPWKGQTAFNLYYPGEFLSGVEKDLMGQFNFGLFLGLWAILVGVVLKIAKLMVKNGEGVVKGLSLGTIGSILIGVPGALLGSASLLLSQNFMWLRQISGINEAIIANPELAMEPMLVAIQLGLLAGLGVTGVIEGAYEELIVLIFGE